MTWTDEELNRIGDANELRIAGRRADGSLRKLVIIWQVRVGDHIYVRSVNGPDAAWFGGTQLRGEGRIEAGGISKDVVFSRDDSHDAEIDVAYRAKYGTGSPVRAITSPLATSTTLRVDPARKASHMNEILTLNNGVEMPALGLGVFQSSADDTASAVETALRTGYRLIDTAAAYRNERQVGEGIRASGIDRGDIFIETKVWISQYGYDETLHAFDLSARKLGVDYLDLLILHQPTPKQFDRTLEAYRALETLLADGRVRAIGVSNFKQGQLDDLMEHRTIIPALNQIELHPYFTQQQTQNADAGRNIVTQAWSPIGGINFYPGYADESAKNPLEDPVIGSIATAHGKTAAQVMIRWHLQQGRSAIPKSVQAERIRENFDVFDFELDDVELAQIDSLDQGIRRGPEPDDVTTENRNIEISED
jgi:2,5-diketo-D-gluconate reductase A